MLFPDSVRANRGSAPRDLFALEVGQEIVLLGRPSTFADLPRELFRPNIAMMLLRQLSAMPGLRRYLAGQRLAEDLSRLTDRDVLQQVDWAIRTRQLDAIVVIGGYGRDYTGPPIRPGQPAPPAPTGGNLLRPDEASVASWSNEERIAEVIRRAIARAPAEIAADLRLLLTADGVGRVVDSVAFDNTAKPTQHSWATGGAVAGIALAFGSIAGLYALSDVVDFLKRAAEARTPRDLETAAEALARAVTVLGVPGLLAVLHKAGMRQIADARPPAEEIPSFRQLAAAQAARLAARQQRIPPPMEAPPPRANPIEPLDEMLFPSPAAQAATHVAGARSGAPFMEICKG
jgi:hypothetical protein